MLDAYRRLGRLRRELPALTDPAFGSVSCTADEESRVFTLRRGDTLLVVNFGDSPAELALDPTATVAFETPSGVTVEGGRLVVPGHGGALITRTSG